MMIHSNKLMCAASLIGAFSLAMGCAAEDDGLDDSRGDGLAADRVEECDVVVAGGSTAALAAALTSAEEGAVTCLLEPTDWPGGQLTAGGTSAIDFAWHS
ncbi:MAG: FAD-dependent oxidoreductase, partial [Myxococcota bacterium]